jgi:dipeptidyl aminopeptidase/acylaminoacyl peptidase
MRTLLSLTLLVMIVFVSATPAAAAAAEPEEGESRIQVVQRWLALGPDVEPLPAFHEEKPGSVNPDALLVEGRLPEWIREPRAGDAEPWPAGSPRTWGELEAGDDGTVVLEPPDGPGSDVPASAWIAAYLQTNSWASPSLQVYGAHPVRAWLDGEPVSGLGEANGSDGDLPKRQAKIKLTRGKHLLVLQSLRDPSKEEGWFVGAGIEFEGEAPEARLTVSLDPERDIDITDILDAPRINSVAVSPGGDSVAVVVRRILPGTDDNEDRVEIRSTEDGRTIWTWRGFEMDGVAWAPTGNRISYVTREKLESKSVGTLWVADLETGEVRLVLSRVENLGGHRWAPDGRSIVYAATVNNEPDKRGIKRLEDLRDRMAGYRDKSYLYLVSVPDGVRRRLTAGASSTDIQDISPDGKRLLFTRTLDDMEDRPFTRTELWQIDLSTLESSRIRDSRWLQSARYAPDGRRLLILAGPSEFGQAGRNVPEGVIPNDYDHQLYIWDPESDRVDAITREFAPKVSEAFWNRADGNIYMRAEDRDYYRLYRYRPVDGSFTPFDVGIDAIRRIDVAANAPVAVAYGTSPWKPHRLVAVDLSADESTVLLQPARDWYRNVRRGAVDPWHFTASGGRTIEGRIYLPPDFDSSNKYPCIVYYYGGTNPITRNFGGRYPKEYWAANGYVVYVLQPSGATGYGQAFSALHVNDWSGIVSREIVEGTKKFLEAHPFVDPKRVGCIGASYGGFMTMMLVGKTDIYAAAVSHAGISDLSSYWGEGYWGYLYSSIATADSFPWNRKDIYVDRSPLFHADKVKTPILLTHGAADTNVPKGESDTFYAALKLLGAPVEYVQIEGQDHLILEHGKRLVWSRTIVAWFDRWLKDQPGWWNDLYPEPE